MKIDKKIIDCLNPVEIFAPDTEQMSEFTGVSQDSRKISEGNIFICVEGEKFDGHKFAAQAVENGAALIISQKKLLEEINCPYLVVKDTKVAIAFLSAHFHGCPSKNLDLIGVTGTNGKTTVTHLVETIFEKTGESCALIGTLGNRFSSEDAYEETEHTTPQAPELQQRLRKIADNNIKKVVMEVSSHSLDQHRVSECEFSGSVFTNLTQDHLDYHITMENYFLAKAKLLNLLIPKQKWFSDSEKPELFEGSVISENRITNSHPTCYKNPSNKYAVINIDDKYFSRLPALAAEDSLKILTYGVENEADIRATDIKFSVNGSKFLCKTPVGSKKASLQLVGLFNIYNALAAIGVGIAEGIELKTILSALESVPFIPGRFEVVSKEPLVIIDYAHTPNGLENALEAAKQLVPKDGNLICVFGCGGDRDVTKRPQMGRIAENLCDKIVITSDNPRTEDPQQIITDVLTGIRELDSSKIIVELDRTIAIEQALFNSSKKDVIVVAGKGHEDYQIIGNEKIYFDDKEEIKKTLKKLKKKKLFG